MLAFDSVFRFVEIAVALPTAVLLAEVLSACFGRRKRRTSSSVPRPRAVVLVPARDEDSNIGATLRSVRTQMAARDRLVVIADNCSDRTAEVAIENRAEVFERSDKTHCGKGYALDFGVRLLSDRPPEVVVVIDADCRLEEGSLDLLVRTTRSAGRPVQALYRMDAPPGAGWRTRIASFAWLVKNYARPLGLSRLGLPCHLFGSGMAFPRSAISRTSIGSPHVVEDLKLGLDLATHGAPPLFIPEAVVRSSFPRNRKGLKDQRLRWEHGYMSMMIAEGPRVLAAAVRRRDAGLLALGLDLTVPPLALLTLVVCATTVVGVGSALETGRWAAAIEPGAVLGALALAVGLAWIRFGRSQVSLSDLWKSPIYALSKIPIYAGALSGRRLDWVRTLRDPDPPVGLTGGEDSSLRMSPTLTPVRKPVRPRESVPTSSPSGSRSSPDVPTRRVPQG